MYAFYSGLANYVTLQYNTVVSSTVLNGNNVFINDMPDEPSVAVVILSDGALRTPGDVTRRPEFVVGVRAARNMGGPASQMASRIYKLLDGKANVVTGYPCFVRALEEPVSVGMDSKSRPVYVTRFVLWGTNFA